MKDKYNAKTFLRENGLQLAMQVFAVLALVLNLWLASKLSPLAQNVAIITERINAIETDCNDHQSTAHVTEKEFDKLSADVNRLEDKVDRIMLHFNID